MLRVLVRPSLRSASTAVLMLLAAIPAHSQTGQTAQIPLQFDFLNPGARSLAMGSAFIAFADDATTAFTNPAGLTLSLRKEVSAEIRYRRLDTPYLSSGRLSGTPSGEGLDTVAAPIYGISPDGKTRPYFLAFVYPHGRWSVAAYRHELVLQTNTFISQGPFYRSGPFNDVRLFGLSGDRDIDIVTYGVSAAYRVSEHLSLGEGFLLYRFGLDSHFGALSSKSGFFGPVDLSTFGQNSTTTQNGTGVEPAFNIGVLVTVNRTVRFGGVVRQAASFLFTQENRVPATATVSETGTFRTPGVIGVGVRISPADEWAFAVDYDWVQYSRLTTNFIGFQVDPAAGDRVGISNGNELHLGVEYTFLETSIKPSLRAGVWFDPDHAVQYASDGSGSDLDTRLKAVFPGGADAWHFCAGFGMPLSRAYEINFGSDFTSRRHYLSASLVARFGK
jgi:long-subunit fatty acid transport protein